MVFRLQKSRQALLCCLKFGCAVFTQLQACVFNYCFKQTATGKISWQVTYWFDLALISRTFHLQTFEVLEGPLSGLVSKLQLA